MSEDLTLYDLETGLIETAERVAQMEAAGNDEELADAILALESYVKESVIKRDNCGRYLMSLDATDDAIDSQIAWLQDKQQKIRKKRGAFSKHILFIMARLGVKKLEGTIFSFKARQNPMRVEIIDHEKIPAFFLRLPEPKPPELQPDKAAIKEALQDGQEVPGARLVQETRLVIDQ